tara:strand:+ start:368 stop:934 length:567 start_codon:yes stop_codon:yes gene_type:complete
MSKSRKFRKIILKSEVSVIEEEEFIEQYEIYNSEFSSDFSLELAYLKHFEEQTKQDTENEEKESLSEFSNEFLKSLHRELARVLHPDLNQNSDDEDFKKMQAAYEAGDASVLIYLAALYNININFDDEDLEKIEQQIIFKNKKINERKKTCLWAWGSSSKNENIKIQIRDSLGIDEEEFKEWLTTNKE